MGHNCVHCGAELLMQTHFCTACGHPIPNAEVGPEGQGRDRPIVFLDRLNALHDMVIPRAFSRFFEATTKHSEISHWKNVFLDLQVQVLFGSQEHPDLPYNIDQTAPRVNLTLGSLMSLATPLKLGPMPTSSTHVVLFPLTTSIYGNVAADLIRDECWRRVPIPVRIAEGYGVFGAFGDALAFWNKEGDEFFNTPLNNWLYVGIEISPVDGSVLITLQTDGSRVSSAVEIVGG